MKTAIQLNNLFKTLKYKIYANRTNDGTPDGCKQAMDDSIRIEQIADDFAIEFAEWIASTDYRHYSNGWSKVWEKGTMTSKELLEIYKKEKGL
jgi:hypothetical protein